MATNLPFCFTIQFWEHFLKFLVNFILLKFVQSQRSYGFLITKKLIFGFQILDLKDHFLASLKSFKVLVLKSFKLDEAWAYLDSQFEKNFFDLQSNFSSQDESQIQHFECHDYGQTHWDKHVRTVSRRNPIFCSSISIKQYRILLIAEH